MEAGAMCRHFVPALILCLLGALPSAAHAGVVATVDLSEQRVYVSVDGWTEHVWPVSTARRGYWTPVGSFRAKRKERMWYSRRYDWTPMPYSVFFHGGYAIHGSYAVRSLGRPASHGCIRLHPAHAARLYWLVSGYGLRATRIVVRY